LEWKKPGARAGLWLGPAFILCCCGPTLDEQVERLAEVDSEAARHELLLAKERAVEPLLAALDAGGELRFRAAVVDVLFSLLNRIDDPRIAGALELGLLHDGDAAIRANIARSMGLYKRTAAIPALLRALGDEEAEVRWRSLEALGTLGSKLTPEQRDELQARSRLLADDEHPGTRMEAVAQVEAFMDTWLEQARQAALSAHVARAESLYCAAVSYYPASKRGNQQLASFYLDNDRREQGLSLLRQHGMLLEVPRLDQVPDIDGVLNEAAWASAARVDTLLQFTRAHKAAMPSAERSSLYVARGPEALYFGFVGHDSCPDSLVVGLKERDDPTPFSWEEDRIELFFDANLDRRSYVHIAINSAETIADGWYPNGFLQAGSDEEWDIESRIAVQVGSASWSVEGEIPLGQPHVPVPGPGALWGFNFVRVFRGSEFGQWTRTYGGNAHTPVDFGLMLLP